MNLKKWYTTEEAIDLLGVGRTNLMMLKDNDLTVGIHWVYTTGRKRGVLGWDVQEIQKWQIERSSLIANQPNKVVAEVETYAEMGV